MLDQIYSSPKLFRVRATVHIREVTYATISFTSPPYRISIRAATLDAAAPTARDKAKNTGVC